MATAKEIKEAKERFNALCREIETAQFRCAEETLTDRQKRIKGLLKDYSKFVEYYFPHYCTKKDGTISHCAPFHKDAAKKVLKDGNIRAVFQWARGHAKSTHLDVMIPLWLLAQKKDLLNVMVLVGKSESNAAVLLGDIQAELQYNYRYIDDFGVYYNQGDWAEGHFVTAQGQAFFALGRGQSPRGLRYREHRPDYIVIDDLDDDEITRNDQRVRELTEWVKEALFGCFGPDGGRFIMVGNLIAKNSVLYNMSQTKGVTMTRVNITDKDGKPSWPDVWSPERIEQMKEFMGYRGFQREYMNNPITGGAVFKADWIRYKPVLKWKEYDSIVAYCDPSFKATDKSDYKAVKVWGKKGSELHCLKAFCRQCTVGELVRWFYDLHEVAIKQGIVIDYYIEANMLQDMLLDEFATEGEKRGFQLPIRADKRKKPDKYARIENVSALWERGFVWYDIKQKDDADFQAALEQTLSFEKGMRGHDDAPDADEGAIFILQKTARAHLFEPEIGRRNSPKNAY